MANATLPSALVRFTSEFGMGSGGTTPLWPPGKPVGKENGVGVTFWPLPRDHLSETDSDPFFFSLSSEDLVKSADCVFVSVLLLQRLLVLYDQAARAISTG